MDANRGPEELLNKVQFDIRYYFARRGGENIYDMTKSTFKCITDRETGVSYVTRAEDEATKNHKEGDNAIISGYMPELPGSKYCPVQSFMTYIISLDKRVNHLWQKANRKIFPADGKGTWYGPRRLGKNTMNSFMTELAKDCGLGHLKYTNHSLRVTAITTLTHQNFSNKQIMALTGHKSEQSLAIYQRINSNEKISMGFSLCSNLLNMQQQIPPPQQVQQAIVQPVNVPILPALPLNIEAIMPEKANVTSEKALVPFIPTEQEDPLWEDGNDFDLMAAIAETQQAEIDAAQNKGTVSTSKSMQVIKKNSPKIPMIFNNCKIEGNITINLTK